MRELPKGGMFGKVQSFLGKVRRMEIPTHASHACYFLVLAVFPALTLLLGLLRYTALEAYDLMDLVGGVLPNALEPYIWKLISGTYENTSKVVVSVSALTALWSAGRGIHGVVTGLNAVYGVEEQRGWLQTRLMSMFYTILFLVVLVLSLVLHVFGNTIEELIHSTGDPRFLRWMDIIDWGVFALIGAEVLLFTAMFMFLPCRHNGFRESLPGALFASLGWMTFSSVFSIYVENFSNYTNIYGSVYAVALAMLWLYMCVSIVFYGAVLNRLLAEARGK
ncbi:MAG: YihY/virulence factor BrkB family protein [Oscillospiraceae bacterium]|nr:YihY/virulence factor BrkB family protein [Oscillospiraceae bacterium]